MTSSDDELLRLQALIYSAPLPMAAVRPDGYVLFANDHALALFGLRREDDPQQNTVEFFNDPADHERLIAERLAGLTDSSELRMKRADGTPIRVLVSSEMVVVGGEQLVISGLQDITSLRLAEEALRVSEQRFRALIQNSDDVISVLDPKGVILYNSPTAIRTFGFAEDEAIGTQSLDYIHPDEREAVVREGAVMLANPGAVARYECRVRHKDGHYLVVEAVVTNLIDDAAVAGLVVNYWDITERTQAREALQASERRFRALIENSSDMITIVGTDGRITYASPSIRKRLGYRETEFVGRELWQLLHPDDVRKVLARFRRARAKPGARVQCECRVRHKKGHWVWVEALLTNLAHDPAIGGVVVNCRDITQRKAAEAELQASEQRFRALVEAGEDIITCFDDHGVITFTSPSTARILGYEPEEWVGQKGWQFIRPEDVPGLRSAMRECLSEPRKQVRISFRARHKGGHDVWAEGVCTNLYDDDAVRAVVVNYRDVTEKMRHQEILQQSEERFRLIASATSDAIWDWDLLTGDTWFSDGMRALFGHALASATTNSLWWLERIHPDDRDRVEKDIGRAIEASDGRWEAEYRFLKADGSYADVFDRGFVIRDDEGRPVRMLGGISDVTARVRAEEELRISEESFRSMADGSTLGMSTFHRGMITYANAAFAGIFGYEADEIMGMPGEGMNDLIHPDDRELAMARSAARLRGEEQPTRVTYRGLRKDGETIWIEADVSRFYFEGEMGLLTILSDITERKETEVMLRRLSSVVEQTADAVFVTDAQGIIQFANPATERMTGYTAAELLGKTPRIFGAGEMPARFYKRLWETILAGRDFRAEFINRRKDGSRFYEEKVITPVKGETGEIIQFVSIGRDVTERKQAEETIRHMAYHDPLTGLPNRALFVDRATVAIAQAKRSGGKLAVLFLDLDRLKLVNDTLGHDKGDELIKDVGLEVWGIIRDGDTVARMGGDEYAIVLTGLADADAAEVVAGRIVGAVKRHRTMNGQSVTVTASVGIAIYPDDGTDAGLLLKSADMAMYHAKERGGDGSEMYSHLMGVRVRTRLGLENDLRQAIESGQLDVHYQPQVSVATGEVTGVEALARWNHPDRGPISPAEFIPVAEETGLIIPLQFFVISTAIDQLRAWTSEGLAQFRMAINLSAACLRLPELTADLRSILRERRVEPSRVQFEITESMALADPEAALETLTAVRDLGATIALDDFGTGYSSFGNLRQLPIDTIKLDISLIRDICIDPGAGAIATAVLSMARELGLRVVAEGVETKEQLEALRQRGCDEYQGYLFSKALPADEVTVLLRKGNAADKTRRRKPGQ